MTADIVVVAGAGGFIGGHLVGDLLEQGHTVRAVDVKPVDEWFQAHEESQKFELDLRLADACRQAVAGASDVYNLAADMGGMGFIENNRAWCMLSVLINTHLLATGHRGVNGFFFFFSSACVYAADKQVDTHNPDLR